MMSDIDEMLEGLRSVPADARLAAMDDAVLAGAATLREKVAGRRNLVLTSVAALAIGLFTSVTVPQGAQAEQPVSLNALPPSAPSSLLMGTR